ncbi:MAG: glycoside hydrolase family 9 protein [Lachnospiraceae bacterium]|nr:glycoside hydrolase family 9 protein [Lachnospiraceae bacterium]
MKINNFKKVYRTFLATVLCVVLLAGCSGNELDLSYLTEKKEEQIFDYEVPESEPSVLVNQLGYHPDSVKTVIFIGQNIPEDFSVIEENTDEEVYAGKIEHKGFAQDIGMDVGIGTFTDFVKEGNYYILCDTIGQSYHFSISDMIYNSLFTDLLKEISDNRWQKYHNETEEYYQPEENTSIEVSGGWYTHITEECKVRDVKAGCDTLVNLLMSAEFYLEEQSDAAGIKESGNGIPDILDEAAYEAFWLLKMQDGKTGAVYSGLTEEDGTLELAESDIESCQRFIIAMAKFSYSMKNYDNAFATECLRASDAAWKYVESIRNSRKEEDKALQTEIDETLRFFGAAELFRASGAYRYHTVIREYVPNTVDESKWTKEEYLGIYTYLGTRLAVSKSICEEWMKQIMDMGEEIAGDSKKDSMLAISVEDGVSCQNLLWKMTVMTSIDYIIGNHEYDTILENNLHYLLGRNINSYSYIEGYGNDSAINNQKLSVSDDLTQVSALIFIISEIISNR